MIRKTFLLPLLLLATGCTALRWEGERPVSDWTLATLFGLDPRVVVEDPLLPDVPVRTHLRPCCAFGADLKASIGKAPVPGFSLGNVIGVDDLGPHNYDNPIVAFERSHPGSAPIINERNGLVYTCNGGFIDIAHLRDYADWTVFLAVEVARHLRTGGVVTLPPEGGERRVVLRPVPEEVIGRHGIRRLSLEIGQWLAFEMGVWHEIITWYGWASFAAWPERVSAFSPEDLYSNLVGIKIGAAAVYDRAAGTTTIYNRTMEYAIERVLDHLGALEGPEGKAAMFQVDGLWWDSSKRLPAVEVVIRRNFGLEAPIRPWLVPGVEGCQGRDAPLPLPKADGLGGLRFRDVATFEIVVQDSLGGLPVPDPATRRVTQDDFPAIVRATRVENAAEFGAGSDQPGE